MLVLWSFVLLHFFITDVRSFGRPVKYKLEQLQVLFRHGDRVADKDEIYETDPYDSIYEREGYGQLNKAGKQREYSIGQALRKRYRNFLGDYKSDDLFAYSTNVDRTKMSLQLALAGLYPPSRKNAWSDHIDWLPIPTNYDPKGINFLTSNKCPTYKKLLDEAKQSPEILSRAEKYQDFFAYLHNKTGITITNPFTPVLLYKNIRSALSMDLPLPSWCSEEDFKKLTEISDLVHDAMAWTDEMNRIAVGPTVEQFLKNLNGDSEHGNRKIYMYGAHHINIGTFTRAHNITGVPKSPDFGSTIVLEKLRGPDNQVHIRYLMWIAVTKTWIPMKMKDCGHICPLSIYEEIVRPILPDTQARKCTSITNLCKKSANRAKDVDSVPGNGYLFAGDDVFSMKYMKNFSSSRVIFI